MHAGENAEEISVERRGVWDAGISEQRRKYRGECAPEDHASGEARGSGAVELFNESTDDKGRILGLLPRQHAKNAGLHGKIQNGDADYRNEDAARNIARGIADFASEVANVVVTPVGVDGVDRRGAEGSKKQPGKIPRSRRIGENEARLEMRGATPDEPQNRAHNADPEKKRDFSDGSNAAIEQDHKQNYERAGDRFLSIFSKRVEIRSVLRETDGAGSEAQGSLNQRLPDEQEGHQSAHAAGAVGFAKENVATPGKRHSRAQF